MLIEESIAALLNWIRKPWCLGGKKNSFIGGKEYCMTKTRQTRDNCDSKELMQPFLLDPYAFFVVVLNTKFQSKFCFSLTDVSATSVGLERACIY